jgi:phosphoserine phosphatase RsbU/P
MAEASSIRVLVVEDSPQDVFLLRMKLARIAHVACELLHVERLGEALQVLRQHPVDLILTDLNLPDSDGLETVRPLVQHAGAAPVVVLFGCSTPGLGEKIVSSGAWGSISKDSLTPDTLSTALQEASQRKEARA